MKILTLLTVILFSSLTGSGQYVKGERYVGEKEIPDLFSRLKKQISPQQKAEVLLRLGYGYLYMSGEKKTDLDTAMLYAQQAYAVSMQTKNTPLTHESLLLISMTYMEQKDLLSARNILPAMNDSNSLKMQLYLSKYYANTAELAPEEHSNLDSAAYYAQGAVKLASKTRVLQRYSLLWLNIIAQAYQSKHLLSLAENQYIFMLDYCDGIKYPSKAHIFNWLCTTFTSAGEFYKATGYGISAEKALNKNSTDAEVGHINLGLGSMYSLQGKYEKSLPYFMNILSQPGRYSSSVNIYGTANSYSVALRRLHRTDEVISFLQKFHQQYPPKTDNDKSYYHLILANTYKDMNMFEPAEKNYLEAIKYYDLTKASSGFIYSYLGVLYDKFKYHEKAIAAYKTAEKGLSNENEVIVATNLTNISRLEAEMGNYQNAYFYLLRSKTISDSIYDVSKGKYTQELDIQYQTQKKEADLRLKEENIRFLNQQALLLEQGAKVKDAKLLAASLLTQKNQAELELQRKDVEILTKNAIFQQTKIDQADAKRKITIIIIALLAIIIVLLFWLFWSKLRSNKVITTKNGLLQQLLRDKGWLLKEMHHRVKNNLHIIMNLLEFQSSYLHDDALEAIKNSQSRIFSMSLIHQKFYQTEDEKTIDMAFYIPELVSYLRESFGLHHNFRINLDIDHTAFLVTEAVPLGLIINEAVTNSMKYAFKDEQYAEINISMKATGADEFELIMTDNGIGLSEGFDIDNVTSLGFQLIKGLSEQLEAQLHIINENGLKIMLSGISAHKATKVKTMENELNMQMI